MQLQAIEIAKLSHSNNQRAISFLQLEFLIFILVSHMNYKHWQDLSRHTWRPLSPWWVFPHLFPSKISPQVVAVWVKIKVRSMFMIWYDNVSNIKLEKSNYSLRVFVLTNNFPTTIPNYQLNDFSNYMQANMVYQKVNPRLFDIRNKPKMQQKCSANKLRYASSTSV